MAFADEMVVSEALADTIRSVEGGAPVAHLWGLYHPVRMLEERIANLERELDIERTFSQRFREMSVAEGER